MSLQSFDAANVLEHAERRREDDPQAPRRHDAAGRRPASRCRDHRRRWPTRSRRGSIAPPRSIRIPGWRPSQRLNRAEYTRAVKDLLAVDVDVNGVSCPPTRISDGFDNIADSQTHFVDADGRLPARRQPDQPAGGRRSQRVGDARPPGRCRAPRRRCVTSKARRSARAAACRCCTSSRPTANTCSRSCCTWDRPATCSAARIAASRSRCRSTASAWR